MKSLNTEIKHLPIIQDCAIITSKPVSKDFYNRDCYGYAVIREGDVNHDSKVFFVRTDLVYYETKRINNLGTDEKEVTEIKWSEEKQEWSGIELTREEINTFTKKLVNADLVPSTLGEVERYEYIMSLMFQNLRNEQIPWGWGKVWRLAKTEDYRKEKIVASAK